MAWIAAELGHLLIRQQLLAWPGRDVMIHVAGNESGKHPTENEI